MSDPKETERVRENFLKKKLGLTDSDGDLDAAIQAVGQRMKGDNTKNRVTVYYLLLEHFGRFDLFGGKAATAVAGAAAAGVAGLASLGGDAKEAVSDAAGSLGAGAAVAGAAVAGAATAAAAPLTGSYGSADDGDDKGGLGWLWWLLLGLLALLLLWWLFFRGGNDAQAPAAPAATEAAASATSEAAAPVEAAPAEGTVAIPEGAGVTTETRDGKPVVKVYFDTGKTDVVPAFAPAAAGLKAYLESNAGSSLAVSGFNDPTGNAAANAELSKNRAVAVKAELVKSGIADASVELVKPEAATDATVDAKAARRVEVTIK